MTEAIKSVSIIPLKGSNSLATWKLQCRMVLMKEGLWSIVNGTEQAPGGGEEEKLAKLIARKDRARALIVLSVEPSLLYLVGDPDEPVTAWKKLSDEFDEMRGGEYFLTFIDDCTHYTWVYVLKHKSEVFDKFQKWKALVENVSNQKLKTLRTDRGGNTYPLSSKSPAVSWGMSRNDSTEDA